MTNNALQFADASGVTNLSARGFLVSMFNDLYQSPSGSNRLAQLNDFWIGNSLYGSLTNSFRGVALQFSNAAATTFGRWLLGSTTEGTPGQDGILGHESEAMFPCSVSPTNTIVVVFRINLQTNFQGWSGGNPVNQVGTIRTLLWSLTNTNTFSGYYFASSGFYGNRSATPVVYDCSTNNWYDAGEIASSTSNRCSIINDNGFNGVSMEPMGNYCVLTYSSDGHGDHYAWVDGVPCVFGAWPYVNLGWTNYQPNSIPDPGETFNALRLSWDNAWCTNAEGGHCAMACEVQAVFIYNAADTNMGPDTYRIASWLPDTTNTYYLSGDSLWSNYEPGQTSPDFNWTNQFCDYLIQDLAQNPDDVVIDKVNGGSKFGILMNIPVIGVEPLTPITLLPSSKYTHRKIFFNQGHNDVSSTTPSASAQVVSSATNYFWPAITNGIPCQFSGSQLYNTNSTFFGPATIPIVNSNILAYNEAMEMCPYFGYDDHWKWIDSSVHLITDTPDDHVHPTSTNAYPFLQAWADRCVFGTPIPYHLQPNGLHP